MNKLLNHKKIAIVIILLLSMKLSFAAISFTGIVDEKTKNNKYSLRNLNNYSKKGLSLNAIKSNLQFKGVYLPTTSLSFESNGVNSMLQYNNGNTTYVYPYKFKVKVPKFKTPSPIAQ